MKAQLDALLMHALATLRAEGTLPADFQPVVQFERTRDPAHGDWASNIALLSGTYFGVQAGHLGIAGLKRDQFVAVQLDDAQRAYLEASGYTAADEGPSAQAGEDT